MSADMEKLTHKDLIAMYMREKLRADNAENMCQFLLGELSCGHEIKHVGGACGACHAVCINVLDGLITYNEQLVKYLWKDNTGWRGTEDMKELIRYADNIRHEVVRGIKLRNNKYRADPRARIRP